MPDTKITALTALTAADPANDVLPIVDVSDTTMAASGTTKKISINNVLGCSGTATLASATITGNLTVDTNTFFVDSANNRAGVGTVSPGKRCEINQSANAITTIGAGEILRLIGDDGNTNGRITEIGFGTGPTSAVYAPVTLGAINTSIAGFNHKAFYIATRTGTADDAPVERYRIANDGVATWSNVGGVAGTAMTLNSTGLGVGGSPVARIHSIDSGGVCALFTRAAAPAAALSAAYITAPVSSGFSNSLVYGFWYQNTGISNPASECFAIRTNSTDRLYIDSSGNVGIGVTPSAGWRAGSRALQLGAARFASLHEATNGSANLAFGAYESGSNAYSYTTTGDAPSRYSLISGRHEWYTAPSGTAGTAITFTQAMTLESTGSLVLGAAAVATTATDGFLYIPGCAGTPTGTPTAKTGRVPLVVDTTNNKLYFYSGGAWVAAN